jgi:tripartite-type tricarboxylate transporter receptor subunit TctC
LYSAALPHIKSGAFRILATTDKILEEPGVPTLREKGFPEAEGLGSWQGFFGPPNLSKPIQDQLTNSIRKVIEVPSVKKALEDAGYTLYYKNPEELREKIAYDYKELEKIVKAAGIGKYSK